MPCSKRGMVIAKRHRFGMSSSTELCGIAPLGQNTPASITGTRSTEYNIFLYTGPFQQSSMMIDGFGRTMPVSELGRTKFEQILQQLHRLESNITNLTVSSNFDLTKYGTRFPSASKNSSIFALSLLLFRRTKPGEHESSSTTSKEELNSSRLHIKSNSSGRPVLVCSRTLPDIITVERKR